MTCVDGEIKDQMTAGAPGKKRSNSGEFKKQDIEIKAGGDPVPDKAPQIAQSEPIIRDDHVGAGDLTKSMVMEMHDIKCNDGIMKVEIISSEAKGMGMKKHTEYLIKGHDSLGEINCYRRYSEFLIFREFLYNRYPGIFIPPVPTK